MGHDAVNVGRCLLPIGSVIPSGHLKNDWQSECDWNGGRVKRRRLAHVTFHAVRGPRTVREFDLAPDLPVGDLGLLLPILPPRLLWYVRGVRLWCPIIIKSIR